MFSLKRRMRFDLRKQRNNARTLHTECQPLTTENFSSCVTRHQKSSLEENSQRNQKYNSLRQKMPMIRIAIVLSGWNDLCQFCILFATFLELFTGLLTPSRHLKKARELKIELIWVGGIDGWRKKNYRNLPPVMLAWITCNANAASLADASISLTIVRISCTQKRQNKQKMKMMRHKT